MIAALANLVGTALQIGGLVLAAYGVRQTRQAWAPDLPGVEDHVLAAWERTKRSAFKVWLWIEREVLGRPRNVTIRVGAATASAVGVASEVHGEVRLGELDPDWTIEQKLAELDRRSRAIRDVVNEIRGDQRTDRKQIKAVDARLTDTEVEVRERIDFKVRKLAIDGLSQQAWGLTVTALGTVLAAFG